MSRGRVGGATALAVIAAATAAGGPAAIAPVALASDPGTAAATAATIPAPAIRDMPIDFGEERIALTKKYLRERHGLAGDSIEITPQMIVVHWTGGPSMLSAFRTFNPARLGKGRPALAKASPLNVSAHFLVERDGVVNRLMPETWMARHVVGLNHCAIGIENVGGPKHLLTAAQLDANERLVRHLVSRHPGIRWLIGHLEYLAFEGSTLFRESDPRYRTRKPDPGPVFMKTLRVRVWDLGLLSRPE